MAREISLMKKLSHPNIVQYVTAFRDGDSRLMIVMDMVSGGSIKTILGAFGALSERQTVLYMRQALSGLEYLHEKEVVHRDLKPDNLLVTHVGELKIADFGASKEIKDLSNTVVGTAYYMAPEVIKGSGASYSADIWSLGCCAVELLTNKAPFSSYSTSMAAMSHILQSAKPWEELLPADVVFTAECKDFIQRCLQPDPTKRPTTKQLMEHPWIVNGA
eukprot:PhF_6_TR6062/c0_g1_i3/m.8788